MLTRSTLQSSRPVFFLCLSARKVLKWNRGGAYPLGFMSPEYNSLDWYRRKEAKLWTSQDVERVMGHFLDRKLHSRKRPCRWSVPISTCRANKDKKDKCQVMFICQIRTHFFTTRTMGNIQFSLGKKKSKISFQTPDLPFEGLKHSFLTFCVCVCWIKPQVSCALRKCSMTELYP